MGQEAAHTRRILEGLEMSEQANTSATSRVLSMSLVFMQFACLAALAWLGGVWPKSVWSAGLMGLGVIVGLWAIAAMRIGNVHVFPEVSAQAQLTTRGPYRWIRHPMYTAVLFVALSWLLNKVFWLSGLIFLILLVDLIIKLKYEERLLCEHFEAYAAYMQSTKRLLPYIF